MAKIIDCIQGSDEWIQTRLGKVTASNFGKAIAGGQGKTRKSYMIKLIAERMTGQHQDEYTNGFMETGKEREQEAREYYEQLNGVNVQEIGFCELNGDVGASPDGLIDSDGLIEIKCSLATTHIENILNDKVPSVYIPQIQGQMWVIDRQWCDFVSYNPLVKDRPYWYKRVERDEKYIAILEVGIDSFVSDMQELLNKLIINVF